MALPTATALSRRHFLHAGALGAAGLMAGQAVAAGAPTPLAPRGPRPELLRRALLPLSATATASPAAT